MKTSSTTHREAADPGGREERNRSAPLDAIRAAAAALVLIHHAFSVITGYKSGGGGAVTIFFVLSGYLLYRPFLGQVHLGSYAIRRVARIVPAYWLALVGCGVVLGITPSVAEFLLLDVRTLGIAWTLQLEAAFYITLPVLAIVLAGSPGRILALTAASVAGTIVVLAISPSLSGGIDAHLLRTYPLMLWAFAPGMLIAALEARGQRVDRRLLFVGIVIVAAGLAARVAYIDVPTAVGSALVVGAASQIRSMPFARVAVVGGAVSYSVYLWHLPLIYRFGWAAIPLSFGVAAVAYVILERPAMRLGRRLARQVAALPRPRGDIAWSPRGDHRADQTPVVSPVQD